jgi:hypothetical protein
MKTQKFSHVVELDSREGVVKIFRLFADGRKDFYTSATIPRDAVGDQAVRNSFAKSLGEESIFDSPYLGDWFSI